MISPSSSSPSEGEIVESESEKATKAVTSKTSTSIDRPFRIPVSISRSPSPIGSPDFQRSRSTSRSPYRANRGIKRALDDDRHDASRVDSRRFKIRYEDHAYREPTRSRGPYSDADRFAVSERRFRSEDRNDTGRLRGKASKLSPARADRLEHRGFGDDIYELSTTASTWHEQRFDESRDRFSIEQSVSDRGHPPVAAAQLGRKAEFGNIQTRLSGISRGYPEKLTAKYVL